MVSAVNILDTGKLLFLAIYLAKLQIMSNPPFKLDFSETRESIAAMGTRFWAGVPKVPNAKKESMAIYTCFIQHVINSIKNTGKGAIVVPTGFLTAKSGIERTIREYIVEKKMLMGVVSMPSNIFANTGTNVSVIFLDKSNTADDVILMDASKLGETIKEGKNQKTLLRQEEIDQIIEAFINRETRDDFSVVVSYDVLKEKGCSFSAGQYFEVKIEYVDITAEEFQQRMDQYMTSLSEKFREGAELEKRILEQMGGIKL